MTLKIELAILLVLIAAAIGFVVGNLLRKKLSGSLLSNAEEIAGKTLEDAKRQAETITKEATLAGQGCGVSGQSRI